MKIDKANIEKFIREKVEVEALTDAQIARLLNVGTSTVSHWRNKFNIKPADKFKRKFKEKYGPDALESFDMMVQNRTTLQEIANYFGFTREYARQVLISCIMVPTANIFASESIDDISSYPYVLLEHCTSCFSGMPCMYAATRHTRGVASQDMLSSLSWSRFLSSARLTSR